MKSVRDFALGAPAVLIVVLVGSTQPVCGQAGEDWPSFLGPRRNSTSIETDILRRWSDGPEVAWHRPVAEGYSMPTVAGGRLFHFDREADHVRLSSFDSESGRLIWRTESETHYEDLYGYSGGPRASPVVDGHRVFTFGADGWLRCHRSEDGVLLWEVDTVSRFGVVQNFFGTGSTPIVEGDILIAQIGGSAPGTPDVHSGVMAPNGSAVVGFDKTTGEVLYRLGDDLASYASPVLTTIRDRRWGLAFLRGGLLAFEPQREGLRFFYPWRARRLQSVNASTPIVIGDEVLITESYGAGASLLRLGAAGFEVIWSDEPRRRPRLACHWNTPVVHGGFIYASSGEKSGSAELRCLKWSTGEVMWSEPGLRRSSLLYVDDHLIVLTEYGELLLIRATPEGFQPITRSQVHDENGDLLLRYPAWSAPILSHGFLYLRGEGRLVALRLG